MRFQIGVVYFLLKDKKIVYIGQTTRFKDRIQYHKQQLLDFDDAKTIQYPIEKLIEMERIWIKQFKPLYNKAHIPKIIVKTKIKSYKRKPMRLRKLTEKSYFAFGTIRDLTVASYLKSEYKKFELVKMYYTLSHITFFDNILEQLGIIGEWIIHKPGINKEKFFDFANKFYPNEVNHHKEKFNRAVQRSDRKHIKSSAIANNSKGYMQSLNHGHY